ncbi:MAG TPA: hypothetical protein DEB39_10890 [Planctomycetaceae bacterium]|nr:hypothetical protein [Planctomycetaceae bacterium]
MEIRKLQKKYKIQFKTKTKLAVDLVKRLLPQIAAFGKPLELISTDVNLSAVEILETYARRFTIEEMFKDLKEEWGLGKQQVRNLNAHIGTFMMNLWGYTMVELWSWNEKEEHLKDRSRSPWDDVSRRPSHGDKRNALKRTMIERELIDAFGRKLKRRQ